MAGICVFCGSRSAGTPALAMAVESLGACIASGDHTLIYGGGGKGVMGAIADAVLQRNGNIIGVIPGHLAVAELMHAGVADMRVTVDMHERKALMHRLADVYVVLPGGFGTMEELFEAVTWAQLELHSRPIAVLNLDGLYDGLVTLVTAMESAGFLSPGCRSLLKICSSTDELLDWLDAECGLNSDRLTLSGEAALHPYRSDPATKVR